MNFGKDTEKYIEALVFNTYGRKCVIREMRDFKRVPFGTLSYKVVEGNDQVFFGDAKIIEYSDIGDDIFSFSIVVNDDVTIQEGSLEVRAKAGEDIFMENIFGKSLTVKTFLTFQGVVFFYFIGYKIQLL